MSHQPLIWSLFFPSSFYILTLKNIYLKDKSIHLLTRHRNVITYIVLMMPAVFKFSILPWQSMLSCQPFTNHLHPMQMQSNPSWPKISDAFVHLSWSLPNLHKVSHEMTFADIIPTFIIKHLTIWAPATSSLTWNRCQYLWVSQCCNYQLQLGQDAAALMFTGAKNREILLFALTALARIKI